MGDGSSNKKDPGWKHNYLKSPKDTNFVTCMFCEKVTTIGIYRVNCTGGYQTLH